MPFIATQLKYFKHFNTFLHTTDQLIAHADWHRTRYFRRYTISTCEVIACEKKNIIKKKY